MCIVHIDKISNIAKTLKEMVEHYVKKEFDVAKSKYEQIFNMEREADNIKRKIIAELSREMFHPIDREELIRLTLTSDDIAAYLKATSRRLLLLSEAEIPPDVSQVILSMIDKIYDATKLLKDDVTELFEVPRKALEIADDVERLEEEVDELRMEALESILKWCETVKVSTCILTKEIIDSLENAADKCEDVADVIRSIAISSI